MSHIILELRDLNGGENMVRRRRRSKPFIAVNRKSGKVKSFSTSTQQRAFAIKIAKSPKKEDRGTFDFFKKTKKKK